METVPCGRFLTIENSNVSVKWAVDSSGKEDRQSVNHVLYTYTIYLVVKLKISLSGCL